MVERKCIIRIMNRLTGFFLIFMKGNDIFSGLYGTAILAWNKSKWTVFFFSLFFGLKKCVSATKE